MDQRLRMLRNLVIAGFVSIFFYVGVAEFVARGKEENITREVHVLFALFGACLIVTALVAHRRMIARNGEALRAEPNNEVALGRWQAGYILIFGISEAMVLFGFALRFIGASLQKAAPFYVVGMALLLAFYPRRP